MSKIIRSALVALAVLSSASAASARIDTDLSNNARTLSSYDFNNPADTQAFWDAQTRNGR